MDDGSRRTETWMFHAAHQLRSLMMRSQFVPLTPLRGTLSFVTFLWVSKEKLATKHLGE